MVVENFQNFQSLQSKQRRRDTLPIMDSPRAYVTSTDGYIFVVGRICTKMSGVLQDTITYNGYEVHLLGLTSVDIVKMLNDTVKEWSMCSFECINQRLSVEGVNNPFGENTLDHLTMETDGKEGSGESECYIDAVTRGISSLYAS